MPVLSVPNTFQPHLSNRLLIEMYKLKTAVEVNSRLHTNQRALLKCFTILFDGLVKCQSKGFLLAHQSCAYIDNSQQHLLQIAPHWAYITVGCWFEQYHTQLNPYIVCGICHSVNTFTTIDHALFMLPGCSLGYILSAKRTQISGKAKYLLKQFDTLTCQFVHCSGDQDTPIKHSI